MMKYTICGLAVCVIISCSAEDNSGQASLEQKIDSLETVLRNTETRVDSLLMNGSHELPDRSWYANSIEGRTLQQQGVEDPAAFIEQSLIDRPELIPMEPVMGGTMRFVKAQVLGSQWIIAEYEDGHVMGRTIYRYEITADGDITFTELASSGNGS